MRLPMQIELCSTGKRLPSDSTWAVQLVGTVLHNVLTILQNREKRLKGVKKRKYAAVWWAIPLSAAAIREHNVKCHSGSVSSAALSLQKARRIGEAQNVVNPIGQAGFSNLRVKLM